MKDYSAWQAMGHITATPGNVVDCRFVYEYLLSLNERFDIREVAYDRYSASMLASELAEAGLTMVEFGQGFGAMTTPANELMNLILLRKLFHDGNPVLRWNADCTVVKGNPEGRIKFVKPFLKTSSKRIDGIVALAMGLDRAMRRAGHSDLLGFRLKARQLPAGAAPLALNPTRVQSQRSAMTTAFSNR